MKEMQNCTPGALHLAANM